MFNLPFGRARVEQQITQKIKEEMQKTGAEVSTISIVVQTKDGNLNVIKYEKNGDVMNLLISEVKDENAVKYAYCFITANTLVAASK